MKAQRRQLGSFFLCLPLCALGVAILGVLRLRHQFPGAAGSPGLLVPFLLPVAGLALEAGGLVALTYTQLRSTLGPPLSDVRSRARAALPVLLLLGGVLLVAETIPRGTEHPGAFANELLASARSSCTAGAVVPVPLLGLSVRCAAPQRIEGPMPGVPSVQIAMKELAFSDDLRSVEIGALELHAARSLDVKLRAGTARVAGLAPWSRSPRFSAPGRLAILLALGGALWVAGVLLLRKPPVPTPAPADRRLALVLGGLARGLFALPGAVTSAIFVSLDQDRAAPVAYLGAALAGALVVAVVAGVLVPRAPQIFNSFRDL
ncbi:MAG: hypothetical protein EOO73_17485 [Myxococcales bacterium]|nr:MAG: hypothetical protein EOO73_17485 [Myxococcales bacterium]